MKTLVFGASLHSYRYAYMAIQRLHVKGFQTIGIGGTAGMVGEVEILTGHPKLEDIHTITMYINPAKQLEHIDYLLSLNPKRIIFNPGAENEEFAKIARQQEIQVVNACTLVMLSIGQYKLLPKSA